MSYNRKVLWTVALIAAVVVLVGLVAASLAWENFVISVVLHSYVRLLLIGTVLICCIKSVFKYLQIEIKKLPLILCSVILLLDLWAIDTVRFAVRGGVSTILLLPICLPLCFLILMHYAKPGNGTERKTMLSISYAIGIPLLLLSAYLEILSFTTG